MFGPLRERNFVMRFKGYLFSLKININCSKFSQIPQKISTLLETPKARCKYSTSKQQQQQKQKQKQQQQQQQRR
jgi:predicted transcriptional regulator YheO